MAFNPQINYKHVLGELSVNRKDPCEILRELISNSYDAGAKDIHYYPLLQYGGLLFFDNGVGLNDEVETNGITPYDAFFSIGRSTKTFGTSVGHKCQGSKLCFASTRFALITRCAGQASWRYYQIENPRANLGSETDISPSDCPEPWTRLSNFLADPDERTSKILDVLNQGFFEESFPHGTMIIATDMDVEGFGTYYDPCGELVQNSYCYNYIRCVTKHGDTRQVGDAHGFAAATKLALLGAPGVVNDVDLEIWTGEALSPVPSGYPYLEFGDADAAKSPGAISRLRDGRFAARFARTFAHEDRQYSLIFCVDGNRRALEGYDTLDRRGKRISGIRLTDHRGTHVSSMGVKVAVYNELLLHPLLSARYSVFASAESQTHYVMLIDGPFVLVTNRNAPSNSSLEVLNSNGFVEKVKNALDAFYDTNAVFRELCQRLNSERSDSQRDTQVTNLARTRDSISIRERFRIPDVELLAGKWFVSPVQGEEHWVGALYAMLGAFVSENEDQDLWVRPLTFSARGIDSVGQPWGSGSLASETLLAVEYKYHFSHSDVFNHPLNITDLIVCWSMDDVVVGVQVVDDYDCFGTVALTDGKPATLTYKIEDIQSRQGDLYNRSVTVVALRELILRTLTANFTMPPAQV